MSGLVGRRKSKRGDQRGGLTTERCNYLLSLAAAIAPVAPDLARRHVAGMVATARNGDIVLGDSIQALYCPACFTLYSPETTTTRVTSTSTRVSQRARRSLRHMRCHGEAHSQTLVHLREISAIVVRKCKHCGFAAHAPGSYHPHRANEDPNDSLTARSRGSESKAGSKAPALPMAGEALTGSLARVRSSETTPCGSPASSAASSPRTPRTPAQGAAVVAKARALMAGGSGRGSGGGKKRKRSMQALKKKMAGGGGGGSGTKKKKNNLNDFLALL